MRSETKCLEKKSLESWFRNGRGNGKKDKQKVICLVWNGSEKCLILENIEIKKKRL